MSLQTIHDYSVWLTEIENYKISQFIQHQNGISVCTGIIQLWLSQLPDHKKWTKYATGIVCLVKDYNLRSHFFKIFNLEANLLWESELYTNFEFKKINENFLCFAANNCNAGFNFSYSDEANKFVNAINRVINQEQKAIELNKHSILTNLVNKNIQLNDVNKTKREDKKSSSNKNNKKINKMEIGIPVNFVHVDHVGITNDSFDFNLNSTNSEIIKAIKELLTEMNLKPTSRNMYQVDKLIKDNGGYEKFNSVYKKNTKADNTKVKPIKQVEIPSSNNRYLNPISSSLDNLQIIDDNYFDKPDKSNITKSSECILDTNKNNEIVKTNETITKSESNNMLSDLRNALDKMRPFLDEENNEW